MEAVNKFILDPHNAELLKIVKGARNGLVYGAKVRFPHALIMSILFGRGSWSGRWKHIMTATKTHALNLAKFVTLYKTLLLFQKKVNGGKARSTDTFIAGLIGGYLIFGDRNAINEQIVLYVSARVLATFIPRQGGLSPNPKGAGKPIAPDAKIFSVFAAVSWGMIMYLFKEQGESIQPGLFSSMVYLYRDSDRWEDLRTLLWHNK